MIRNISCDYCTGSDEGVLSQGYSADDGGVGTDCGSFFYQRRPSLIHFPHFRPRIVHICKNHGRTAEDSILKGHALVNRNVVLNLAVAPNCNIRANDNVLTDVTFFADFRAGKDMGKMPDLCSATYRGSFVYFSGRMRKKTPTSDLRLLISGF